MKKNKILVFTILIVLICSIACVNYAKEFNDLPQTHWAYNYVNELSDKNVINGYVDGSFKPSGTITRAEFLKLIVCEFYSNVQGFDDVLKAVPQLEGKWYEFYVDLASDTNPYTYTTEALNQPITRIEVANILDAFSKKASFYSIKPTSDEEVYEDIKAQNEAIKQVLYDMKYSKKVDITDDELQKLMKKIPKSKNEEFFERLHKIYTPSTSEEEPSYDTVVNTFSDVVDYLPSELLAVSNVARIGLIVGYEDGTFKPENNMTRAEVATVIYRFAQKRGEAK